MQKKLFAVLAFLILALEASLAQTVALDWVAAEGSNGFDVGLELVEDAQGNIISTGYYQGTVDFDPSAAQFSLTSNGDSDAFIKKMDAQGNLVWAKSIGGIGADQGKGIALDSIGNIYVCGRFASTVDFDPGIGVEMATAIGQTDAYVLKLNAAGDFIWAKQFGGSSTDEAYIMSANDFGISCTGIFAGTVDFDPGPGNFNITSASATSDIYVLKLDANGNFQWAKAIGGTGMDIGFGIAQDALGNVFVAGSFSGLVDFDPGPGTFNLVGHQSSTAFVLKVDGSGLFQWVRVIGDSTIPSIAYAITIADNGDVYSTGGFNGTADFDPGPGQDIRSSSTASYDMFVQKLDGNGDYQWAATIGGLGDDFGYSIATNAQGVYFTGTFGATVDFDPSASIFNMTSFNNTFDAFVEKLNHSGQFQWVKPIGGAGVDYGFGIQANATNHVHTIGCFESTVDFDPDTSQNSFTSFGGPDIFIQRLKECSPSAETLMLDVCDSVEINGEVFDSTGIYVQLLQNVFGCDSTLTLNITVTQIDLNVQEIQQELVAPTGATSYQWLDCNNGFAEIAGEINHTYHPLQSGNYAVEITQGNCVDTSDCISVIVIGIGASGSDLQMVFPNPIAEQFVVDIPNGYETIRIIDAMGKIIMAQKVQTGINTYKLNAPSGIYFIQLLGENSIWQQKIIRE